MDSIYFGSKILWFLLEAAVVIAAIMIGLAVLAMAAVVAAVYFAGKFVVGLVRP